MDSGIHAFLIAQHVQTRIAGQRAEAAAADAADPSPASRDPAGLSSPDL